MKKLILWVMGSLVLGVLLSIQVQAGNSEKKDIFPKNTLSLKYRILSEGSTLQSVSENEGDRHRTEVEHYLSLKYSIRGVATVGLVQILSTSTETNSGGRTHEWEDPRISIFYNSLFKRGFFNLSALLRYHIPISRETTSSAGKEKDEKNGKFCVGIGPSFQISDGIRLKLPVQMYKPLAQQKLLEGDRRRDFYFLFFPSLDFRLSDTISSHIGYSNIVTYYTDDISKVGGKGWNKWNIGESTTIGASWAITNKLSVSSYIEFEAPQWIDISPSDIHFYATYQFF